MLLAVNTGKVDATLLDGFIGSYTLHQSANLSLKLAPDYQSKDVGMIAIAGPKSSDTSLLDAINQEMKKLKDNGFIAQVFDKYGIDKTFMVPSGEDQMTNIK
jgi:polar amino acid transport system substrate-binding protein